MPIQWTKSVVPTVMCDALLGEWALKMYCETPEAQKLAKEEGFEFSEVDILKLEFKNILRITNLWDFKNLKKLILSNNRIETIDGLNSLTNLTTLDLSFNNIEVISGLDNLNNLVDLNLAHNKIVKLKNLDALKKLQILMLNNNQIGDFCDVQYLYEFNTIKSISFIGNPIVSDDNYKLKVIAYMPNLCYMDYRLINIDEKKKALIKYKRDVEDLEDVAKLHEKAKKERLSKAETKAFYMEALLEGLSDYQLMEDCLARHEESRLLYNFFPLADVFNEFSSTFRNICNDWVEMGIKEYDRRKNEVAIFTKRVNELCDDMVCSARKEVIKFSELKEHILLKLIFHDPSDAVGEVLNRKLIATFNSQLESLWRVLMSLEICLAERLHAMYLLFCKDLSNMVEESTFRINKHGELFREACKELTDQAIQFYSDFCVKPYEEKLQIIKNAGSESGGLDAKLLELLKKDQLILETILKTGCDVQSSILNEKENSVIFQLKNWLADIISYTREIELERHRQRIMEITLYGDRARKELGIVCNYIELFE